MAGHSASSRIVKPSALTRSRVRHGSTGANPSRDTATRRPAAGPPGLPLTEPRRLR
jgi:hypothetical protein